MWHATYICKQLPQLCYSHKRQNNYFQCYKQHHHRIMDRMSPKVKWFQNKEPYEARVFTFFDTLNVLFNFYFRSLDLYGTTFQYGHVCTKHDVFLSLIIRIWQYDACTVDFDITANTNSRKKMEWSSQLYRFRMERNTYKYIERVVIRAG